MLPQQHDTLLQRPSPNLTPHFLLLGLEEDSALQWLIRLVHQVRPCDGRAPETRDTQAQTPLAVSKPWDSSHRELPACHDLRSCCASSTWHSSDLQATPKLSVSARHKRKKVERIPFARVNRSPAVMMTLHEVFSCSHPAASCHCESCCSMP